MNLSLTEFNCYRLINFKNNESAPNSNVLMEKRHIFKAKLKSFAFSLPKTNLHYEIVSCWYTSHVKTPWDVRMFKQEHLCNELLELWRKLCSPVGGAWLIKMWSDSSWYFYLIIGRCENKTEYYLYLTLIFFFNICLTKHQRLITFVCMKTIFVAINLMFFPVSSESDCSLGFNELKLTGAHTTCVAFLELCRPLFVDKVINAFKIAKNL